MASELGGMTVEEMLERMSSLELTYWRALFRVRYEEQKSARNMG